MGERAGGGGAGRDAGGTRGARRARSAGSAPRTPLRVGILTVGNEVLEGRRADTHRGALAREVAAAGGEVAFLLSVGDDAARIARAIREGLREASLVIVTGGLGATPDDVTREALARAFGAPLCEDGAVRARLEARFRERGRARPPGAIRQALIPRGARTLPNPVGLAPGLLLSRGGRRVVALPGVPSEFGAIVAGSVRPLLARLARGPRAARALLRTYGVGESDLAARIAPLVAGERGVTLGFLPDVEGVEVSIAVAGRDASRRVARIARAVARRLGDAVYSTRGESAAAVVLRRIARRGERLAVAESFTGGAVASRLAAVPGASRAFVGGVVAYGADAKRRALGVSARVLDRHGMVSEATARAMAAGARRRLAADWAVATTGVAGPASLEGKPPGTAFGAVAGPDGIRSASWRLWGTREETRARGASAALDLLRRALLGLAP